MSKEINLTENEKAVLKGGCDSEYTDMCETDSLGQPSGTWVFSAIDNSNLDPKVARGAISSLIKKGLIEVYDNEGEGKSNDMVIVPTNEGVYHCVKLGYTE